MICNWQGGIRGRERHQRKEALPKMESSGYRADITNLRATAVPEAHLGLAGWLAPGDSFTLP